MGTKTYTAKHPCDLEIGVAANGAMLLNSITSSDPAENSLIGSDDGEYAAWDADVTFKDGVVRIEGGDSPAGGRKTTVRVLVPAALVRSMCASAI